MTITAQIKQAATESTAPSDDAHRLCRHLYADGHRCGSPALRRETFCYYHHTNRPPVQNPRLRKQERNEFALSDPADRTALQLSLGEVLRLIASNRIDPRRAGLLLYGLQIASGNIPKPKAEEKRLTLVGEIVDDAELGFLAPEEEVSPGPWNQNEWRKKHQMEALHLEINQKLVRECDARIEELQKQHEKELSQQVAALKYEAQLLRSARNSDPALRSWAEKELEALRVKRENAAKLVNSSPDTQPHDFESPAEPVQIVPSLDASSTSKPPTANRRLRRRELKASRMRKVLAFAPRTPPGTLCSSRKPPARAGAGEQDAHQRSAGGRSK